MVGVPLRASFIWLGSQFPWVNVLAVRSAATRGQFEEVVLHHDSDLSASPYYRDLIETPGVTLRKLDLPHLLSACDPFGPKLQEVWDRLRTPATRSDLLRYAILYAEGGVYLDIDTITLQSFGPICAPSAAFCGEERIVFPASVRTSRDPVVRAVTFARDQARGFLRVLPRGYRTFRKIEHLYPMAVNPAILGSMARSPFLTDLLERMFRMPPERQPQPCAIGPHLLQETVASGECEGLTIHEPRVFFPLGPEISEHWFRRVSSLDVSEVIAPETRLVHWYASVRTKHLVPHIDPDYVRANASTQFFSAIAAPFV